MNVLAEHIYSGGTNYSFEFGATNTCGNTYLLRDTIKVRNNPDLPVNYYISNSTVREEKAPAPDWSKPFQPEVQRFVIPVQWTSWMPDMSNQFILYFWYGSFNPQNTNREPDGMVRFVSNTITIGDSVEAFIPVRPDRPETIGMAAAWYCGGSWLVSGEPDVFGAPRDGMGNLVEMLPIGAGGDENISNITGNLLKVDADKPWMGFCSADRIYDRWTAKLSDGRLARIEVSKGGTEDTIKLYTSNDWMNPYQVLEMDGRGQFAGDTMLITAILQGDSCYEPSMYRFDRINEMLTFTNLTDGCFSRINLLTGNPFFRGEGGEGDNLTACPGAPIKFKVAGGLNYLWHFPDGTTSNLQYPTKNFAIAGNKEVWVEVTNGCGGKDTLYTRAYVRSNAKPAAWFDLNTWNPAAGDTVQFFYRKEYVPGSLTFNWQFGDGTSATTPSPVHVYTTEGNYTVSLMVANNCGSATETKAIQVNSGWNSCTLEARFVTTISGNTVWFDETSVGAVPTALEWELGDGARSSEPAFSYTYGSAGVYTVCLTVFDDATNCTRRICRDLVVGAVPCIADFNFSKNDNSLTLFTQNNSFNGINYAWTFGDGRTSSVVAPVHQYSRPGTYEVCLNLSNAGSNCAVRKCKQVQIGILDSSYCHAGFDFLPTACRFLLPTLRRGRLPVYRGTLAMAPWATNPIPRMNIPALAYMRYVCRYGTRLQTVCRAIVKRLLWAMYHVKPILWHLPTWPPGT